MTPSIWVIRPTMERANMSILEERGGCDHSSVKIFRHSIPSTSFNAMYGMDMIIVSMYRAHLQTTHTFEQRASAINSFT